MTLWVGMDYIKKVTGYKDPDTIKRRILIPHREEIEKVCLLPEKEGGKVAIQQGTFG